MKKFEIFRKTFFKNHKLYEYIVYELHFEGVKRKSKVYEIKENKETILYTSLWQTWKKKQREIEGV